VASLCASLLAVFGASLLAVFCFRGEVIVGGLYKRGSQLADGQWVVLSGIIYMGKSSMGNAITPSITLRVHTKTITTSTKHISNTITNNDKQ
jgi:hypothetical protein